MRLKYLFDRLTGGQFFQNQLDRNTRACDKRLPHHHTGIGNNHRSVVAHMSLFKLAYRAPRAKSSGSVRCSLARQAGVTRTDRRSLQGCPDVSRVLIRPWFRDHASASWFYASLSSAVAIRSPPLSRMPSSQAGDTGSSPVSRSMFSITWKLPKFTRYSVYSVFFPATGWKTACPAVLPSPESRVALLNHLGFEALHRFDLLLKIAH